MVPIPNPKPRDLPLLLELWLLTDRSNEFDLSSENSLAGSTTEPSLMSARKAWTLASSETLSSEGRFVFLADDSAEVLLHERALAGDHRLHILDKRFRLRLCPLPLAGATSSPILPRLFLSWTLL